MPNAWYRPSAEETRARRLEAQREYAFAHGRGNGAAGLGRNERPRGRPDGCEVDYTDEEREFLMAVDRWKVASGTRFPTLTQLLAVLKGLGYRRPD